MTNFIPKAAAVCLSLIFFCSASVYAQQQSPAPTNDGSVDVAKIIQAFTTKETEFRKALADYAFQRDATIQTIGAAGEITGEYHRVSQFVFTDQNERFEKITYFPAP